MIQQRVRVGTTYLLAAQAVFLVSGYAMHIVLGRRLGPVEYGLFGVVLYAATMIRTFVGSGIPMAVARYVSSDPEHSRAVLRTGFRLQFGLAAAVSVLFFLMASPLAQALGDETLAPLFRIAAPITLFFGLFLLILQYYNGLRQYRLQSGLLAVSYLLRAGLAILLVIVGFGVMGAISGLVAATVLASLLAFFSLKRSEATSVSSYPAAALISFSVPLILAALAQALLTDMDLMFVKRLVTGESSAGYYTSAKALAQVTPFAFYALSGALYPAVSSVHAAGDGAGIKRYIEQANRLLLVIILPLSLLVSLNSREVIALVYGAQYVAAASALRWLMFSFSFLAMFIVHKTILTGCGFPRISSLLTLVLLPLCIALQLSLTPAFGLAGAAMASTFSFFAGVAGSIIVIYLKFGAGFNLPSAVRMTLAVLIVVGLDVILSIFGLSLIPKFAVLGIVYLGIIRLFGEIRPGLFREFFIPNASRITAEINPES